MTPKDSGPEPTSSASHQQPTAAAPTTSPSGRSRLRVQPGGGVVTLRPVPPAIEHAKPPRTAGPRGTPHVIKFSAANDAHDVHAGADHGTILFTAQLRLIFWGKEWVSPSPAVAMGDVINDVQSILAGPYLDGLAQYSVDGASVSRIIQLTDEDPPNPFSQGDAADRVSRLVDDGVVPQPDQDTIPAIYAVFLPSEVAGNSLTLPPNLAGLHNYATKWEWDELSEFDIYVLWAGNNGTRDFISFFFSHELVETLTDPDGGGWQVDPRDGSNWHEICDVCNSGTRINGVRVSSYWSNQDNSCIVTDSSFTSFTVQWIWRPSHIAWMGGVDQDGNPWQLTREAIMQHIHSGDVFHVHGGVSGRDSTVGIYYLDPIHPYLATNTDGVPDDNLLALPQRPPS